jgi:hypothetical protein
MLAVEYLARVGLEWLVQVQCYRDQESCIDDVDSIAERGKIIRAAERRKHKWAATVLKNSTVERGYNQGCIWSFPVTWSDRKRVANGEDSWFLPITWPDRVPDLVTWSGQQTLSKIVGTRITMLEGTIEDLYEFRAPHKSVSGLDGWCAQSAIDIGFSPSTHDMLIMQRPALELLAILGLENVPLISYSARTCGFVHDKTLWKFRVESRNGNYYHRWGELDVE